MNVRRHVICGLALGLLLPVAASAADHASASIQVSATVVANCRLTIAPLLFGNYDPLGTNSRTALDGSTQLTLGCTPGTRLTVIIDGGRNAGAVFPSRLLASGDERLRYQLFRDSERTQIWGQGGDGMLIERLPSSHYTIPIFARIPAAQEVAAGLYTDVVTATVDF